MSGGHWDYIQYRFTDIAEDIEKLIEQNGKEKTEEELNDTAWRDPDWYEKYPEDKFHTEYPEEVIEEFISSSGRFVSSSFISRKVLRLLNKLKYTFRD